jgi:hypothetical protein
MKNFSLLLLLVSVLFSCSQKNSDQQSESYVPGLVLVDSLKLDRLVVPSLLDYSEDNEHFLFFDFKSNELILTDNGGKIFKVANRAEDGPNSYKSSYFSAVRFVGNNQILVETYTGSFLYDLEFNLIDTQPTKIQLLSRMMGDTPGFVVDENYQFKFGYLESDINQIRMENRLKMDEYDFLKVSNMEGVVLFSSRVPKSVNYIQTPGDYMGYDPIAKIKADRIYLLFMLSPIIYTYSFPALERLDSLYLDPTTNFKQIKPAPEQENFGIFFEELKGSRYEDFVFSNDYLLTWYLKGSPDEEVDALDRSVVGDEVYEQVEEKYKSKVYQIFKEKEKVWEGEWAINLRVKKDRLYSLNAKLGEDPNAVERDVQTFYFYELK